MGKNSFTFIDLFAGIGGFHIGMSNLGGKCVFASEIDPFARKTYLKNFNINEEIFNHDITKMDISKIDDFDILCAGFPCQPFSSAGLGLGELDIRGTMFYDIVRIAEREKPKYILLENVKGLNTKRHKPTLDKIISELKIIGYKVYYDVLNTKDYGIPQNRERLWIFATLDKNFDKNFVLSPNKIKLEKRIKDLRELELYHNNIILDPGIGFGKNLKHNITLIKKISLFHSLGFPIMIGTSRKRFIKDLSGINDSKERLGGTVSSSIYAMLQGVQILRVHNINEVNQSLKVFRSLI